MGRAFQVAGRILTCPVCGATEFEQQPGLLETRGATLLDIEWLNRGATLYICVACRNVLWFADSP